MNYKKLMIRSCMVAFWLGAFAIFLLAPQFFGAISTQKSITVLAWPTLIDPADLAAFEEETGIKVHLRYFENNEELYTKMVETKGSGYDLVMPSDYAVDLMTKEGLLKKIDKSKLTFFSDLHPHLVGNYYDPHNEYSVPFFWSIYGIGYLKDYFKDGLPIKSWALIFDEKYAQPHTCMVDDPREAILIASQYLYGKQESLSQEQVEGIKKLLIRQKNWIEIYSEERSNFLLASHASPVAAILSAIIERVMREFDHIEFVLPDEGSFLVIDSFAMPKTSNKEEFVYKFLNYVYKPEIVSIFINKFAIFSPIKSVAPAGKVPFPTAEQFKKLDFFRNIITKKQISDIWIALKEKKIKTKRGIYKNK